MSVSRVADIMSSCIITVSEGDTLARVIEVFGQAKISGAPVVNAEGSYVGVISKTDLASYKLVQKLQAGKTIDTITAQELMNPNPPMCVPEDGPIDNAVELMDKHQVHRIFVTNPAGQIIGIVTTLDVVSRMRYSFESYL